MMQPDQTGTNKADKLTVDMRDFMSLLRKKRLWLFLPTLFVCVISILYVLATPHFYESQARISVDESSIQADETLESFVAQLNHVGTVNKVIADLGLQRRAEFDPLTKGVGLSQSFLIGIGLAKDPRAFSKSERVLSAFFERLSVQKISASRSVIVRFKTQDAKLAASITNLLVDEAVKAVNQASSPGENAELRAFTARLAEIDAQIEALRRSNPPPEAPKNGGDAGSNAAARSQINKLQMRANFIREAVRLGRITEVSEIVNQEAVKRLLEQRKQIKSQIAFDERNNSPNPQRMKELFSQLNAVDSQLRAGAEKTARAYEDEARNLANSRGIPLPAEGQGQGIESPSQNGLLAVLEQEAAQLRAKLTGVRYDDAKNNSASGIKIDQRARLTNANQTIQKAITVFYNTFVAFMLCFVGVIFSELFLGSRKNKLNVSSLTEINPYSERGHDADYHSDPVPSTFDWAQNALPISYKSEPKTHVQPVAEAINQNTPGTVLPGQGTPLASSIENSSLLPPLPQSLAEWTQAYSHLTKNASSGLNGGQNDKLAVENISRELQCMGYLGRGKVTVIYGMEIQVRNNLHAIRLGRRLSKEGATITIELFKKDALYAQIAGQNLAGLGNYLEDEASLAQIIHRDAKSKLHVIPLGGYQGYQMNAAKHKDKLELVINLLSQSYSHIVVDAGPIGSDGEALASLADAIVIITQCETTNPSLVRSVNRIEALSAKPVFVVHDEFLEGSAEQQLGSPRIVGVVR